MLLASHTYAWGLLDVCHLVLVVSAFSVTRVLFILARGPCLCDPIADHNLGTFSLAFT
jgi:hypothetical protein